MDSSMRNFSVFKCIGWFFVLSIAVGILNALGYMIAKFILNLACRIDAVNELMSVPLAYLIFTLLSSGIYGRITGLITSSIVASKVGYKLNIAKACFWLGITLMITNVLYIVIGLVDQSINADISNILTGFLLAVVGKAICDDAKTELESDSASNLGTNSESDPAPKRKYCAQCGSLIDPETRKCTGCGKQYLNLKRHLVKLKKHLLVISLLLNIGLVIYAVYIYNLNEYNAENVNIAMSKYRSEKEELDEAEKQNAFFDKNAAIVTEYGTVYHKYDCYYWKGKNYYIYSIGTAKAKGYEPCSHCQ